MKWQVLTEAVHIPPEWDVLAGSNILLSRAFLVHLERENPCRQSYNLCYAGESLKGIYVDYRLKLDVFTYSFPGFKIPVRILGIPCSVAKQGYCVAAGWEQELIAHFHRKRGAKLILNSEQRLPLRPGQTLPSCKLAVEWASFRQYLQGLRSHYRYRINKALQRRGDLQFKLKNPGSLDDSLYQYYEEVYANSSYKLEKLSWNFFKGLPLPSVIIEAAVTGQKLGFVQLVRNDPELIFLFGGFNHSLNQHYDIYLNLLLEIIRYGIDNKFKVIELGQTAEETKLKLGGQLCGKYMFIHHSNPVINSLAQPLLKLLSYQVPAYDYHVFRKGDKDEGTSCKNKTGEYFRPPENGLF
ncbi:MAG: hypothetical protein ACOWWO_02240 [Peptococcaceae bacterium]